MSAVANEHLYLHCGVEAGEYALGYLYTCEYAVLLNQQMRLAHCCVGDAAEGCVVTIAYVLSKCEVDKAVF